MGIRIKILNILALLLFSMPSAHANSDLDERRKEAYSIIDTDPVKGNELYKELIEDALKDDNWKIVVQSYYIRGWSQEKQIDNLAQAVLLYLEGVRYAENFEYEGSKKDLIQGLKYTGQIFSRYGDFENSLKYYSRAMDLAEEHKFFGLYCNLLVSTAQIHFDMDDHETALTLLDACFDYFHELDNRTIATIYNEQGLIYSELGRIPEALSTFTTLQKFVKNHEDLETEFMELSLHNIGDAYMQSGEWANAVQSFKEALAYKKGNGANDNSIFFTLSDLGECLLESGHLTEARAYFQEAESLLGDGIHKPGIYKLYKLMSRMNLLEDNMVAYMSYQDLYGATLEAYLSEQQQTEAADKKYNLELITTRYFEHVAEQERSRQIRQFAQMGGLAMIFLIISILGYYQYSRYRLRRDLETALRPYAETVYIE